MNKLVLLFLSLTLFTHAQDYVMQKGQNIIVESCAGNIYDDGGASANYEVGEVSSITIKPDQAGKIVELTLMEFGLSYYTDWNVYAGTSTNSMLSFTEEDPYLFTGDVFYGNPADGGAVTLEIDAVRGVASFTDVGFHFALSCVDAYPEVDIYYSNFTFQKDTLVAGSPMMLNRNKRLDNGFTDVAAYYKEKVVFSTDKIMSEDDVVLDSLYSSSSNSSSSEEFFADYKLAEGWYYVLGKLDADDLVPETDESNNVKIDSIYLKEAKPDLAGINVVLGKDTINPENGDNLTWEFYVENLGNLRMFTNSTYYLSTDSIIPTTQDGSNTFVYSQHYFEIGEVDTDAGSVYSWNLDDLLKGEKYYLILHADEYGENVSTYDINGKYDEVDEENNWYIKPFWIYGIPDTTYPMPSAGTEILISCDTVISDAGGINNIEQLGNAGTLILKPDADDKKIVLDFVDFTYSAFDDFYWYDADNTSENRSSIVSLPAESLVSSHLSGAITLSVDIASSFGDSDGFVAVVSCENKDVTSVDVFDESNHIIAYPNPTKDLLFFNSDMKSVNVYDVLGNKVLSVNESNFIDLQGLISGQYIIEIESQEGMKTTRIVKQ